MMQLMKLTGLLVTLMVCLVLAKNDNKDNENENGGTVPLSHTQLEYNLKKNIVQSLNYHRANVEPTAADMRYVVS